MALPRPIPEYALRFIDNPFSIQGVRAFVGYLAAKAPEIQEIFAGFDRAEEDGRRLEERVRIFLEITRFAIGVADPQIICNKLVALQKDIKSHYNAKFFDPLITIIGGSPLGQVAVNIMFAYLESQGRMDQYLRALELAEAFWALSMHVRDGIGEAFEDLMRIAAENIEAEVHSAQRRRYR